MKTSLYVFSYESGWMIIVYEGSNYTEYFSCAEEYWDTTLKYIRLLNIPEENRFEYKLGTYDELLEFEAKNSISIFKLDGNEILELSKYKTKII